MEQCFIPFGRHQSSAVLPILVPFQALCLVGPTPGELGPFRNQAEAHLALDLLFGGCLLPHRSLVPICPLLVRGSRICLVRAVAVCCKLVRAMTNVLHTGKLIPLPPACICLAVARACPEHKGLMWATAEAWEAIAPFACALDWQTMQPLVEACAQTMQAWTGGQRGDCWGSDGWASQLQAATDPLAHHLHCR